MSYNWQNGELITAEKLNQTGGVLIVNAMREEDVTTLDKTWQEIYNADSAVIKILIPCLDDETKNEAYWENVVECDPIAFTVTTVSRTKYYATDANSYPTDHMNGGGGDLA